MESLGYTVLPFRLRACCFGADHQRDRLFLLAELPDAQREPIWLQGHSEGNKEAGSLQGEAWERERIRPDAGPVVRDEQCASDSRTGGEVDGVPSKVDRLRGLGNAVYPAVAEWIGRRILEGLHGNLQSKE